MGQFVLFIISAIAVISIYKSLRLLFIHPGIKDHLMPIGSITVLLIVYITIIIGFGLLYTSGSLFGFKMLAGAKELEHPAFSFLIRESIYFSASTMLSVGYGDVLPVGMGKVLAVSEALLGYLLPISFVLSSVINHNKPAD